MNLLGGYFRVRFYDSFYYWILDYPNHITTTHFRCDLCNSARLEKILVDVDVIFHLARKSVAYMLCADQSALNEQYLTDNLNGILL